MSRLPYIIVLIILLAIVSPYWFSYGMFMDGLIYSTVAKNLHDHLGSFVDPQFTPFFHAHFHEHPPLGMYIQSGLYAISSSPILDRWYSIITLLLSGWVMVKLWCFLEPNKSRLGYWGLLFWGTTPLIIWALPNNLLENLMGLWVMLAILYQWKSFRSNHWGLSLLTGLLWTLSFYTKGPVGLFPMALGPILWLLKIENRTIVFKQWCIAMGFALALFFIPYWSIPELQMSWNAYFHQQIEHSLQRVVTVDSRFYILFQTLNHAIPMLAFLGLIGWYWRKHIQLVFDKKTWALLLLGLSGIVPMMISLKQREFYIIPAWPLIVLSVAMVAVPILEKLDSLLRPMPKKWGIALATVLIIGALANAIRYRGDFVRDSVTQSDLKKIAWNFPHVHTIHFTSELHQDYSLIGYAQRFFKMGLDPFKNDTYVITTTPQSIPMDRYKEIDLNLKKLHFYNAKP